MSRIKNPLCFSRLPDFKELIDWLENEKTSVTPMWKKIQQIWSCSRAGNLHGFSLTWWAFDLNETVFRLFINSLFACLCGMIVWALFTRY